uniref:Uncharacterized protein n=1 Tax=Pseudoalteromonas citrea DSM 8771 TaxID=1117314 RepID=U1KRC3_9GAMM
MGPDLRQGDCGGVKVGDSDHGFGHGVMRQLKSLVRPHFCLPEFISGSRFLFCALALGGNWYGPWPSSRGRFGDGVMRLLKSLVRAQFCLPEFISGSRFCVAFLALGGNWHGP